jgi:glucose-6-phosphate 1-dehydrogenase
MSPTAVGQGQNPLRDPRDKRLPRIAGPCSLVLFGVTGDLARNKIMPAIYDLANRGLLPPSFSLVGFARRDWTEPDFAEIVLKSVRAHARTPFNKDVWRNLAEGFRFVSGTFDDPAAFIVLRETLNALEKERGTAGNHAFYLSIPPAAFSTVTQQLDRAGLSHHTGDVGHDTGDLSHDTGNVDNHTGNVDNAADGGWRRVVIEKPFGHDLASARELSKIVNAVFRSDSIFRIDHYLGKETVQNLLALRFANQMFEPIWNANYVDHVQITMAEDIGIGSRAGYYDGIGAARDVIQNHLLQLLALTAMEEPVSFQAHDLRAEKEKVLSAVRLSQDLSTSTVRGQYADGWQGGEHVTGYLNEAGIEETSTTETYAALKVGIDTRRWAGVPFYLRTGKRLGKRVTEIAVVFKRAPHLPFDQTATEELGQNAIVIRVQPDEGVTMRFGSKVPGNAMEVRDVTMDFGYGSSFTESSPEAYERLILDVLLGDPPLFPRREEVELAWQILDPVEAFWTTQGQPDPYPAGGWGPESADDMMTRDGRVWRKP